MRAEGGWAIYRVPIYRDPIFFIISFFLCCAAKYHSVSKHPPKILPLGRVSELLHSELTPFQHKENNKYFEMVWNSLNDGGLSINMNGKNLIKVESENGFRIQ